MERMEILKRSSNWIEGRQRKMITAVKTVFKGVFMFKGSGLLNSCTFKDSNRDYADGLKIVTDIEGGNVYNVRRHSENHFSIKMRPDIPSVYRYPDHHGYWFYFKMEGVKGKKIKIDITNCDWMTNHWKNYKPVYSYAKDPDSLTGVEWQRIEKTKLSWNTFSFVQRFERDSVWVALRYPYNYTREKRYIEGIKNNEYVEIEELGKTAMDNPLYMIVITDKKVQKDKKRGVLIYAREHGVEQDGSWVAEGMVDFLLSSERSTDILLRNFIFMIIPIIAPDSVITGRVVDPKTGYSPEREFMKERMDQIEAKLLYDWVKKFVHEGNTLDVCISLHSPHGTEPNIYPHYRPYNNNSLLEKSKRLHKAILKNFKEYTKWKEFTMKSCIYSVGRLAKDFGSVAILYEVNHQAEDNYLSLEMLKRMGEVFLKGIVDYYGLLQ